MQSLFNTVELQDLKSVKLLIPRSSNLRTSYELFSFNPLPYSPLPLHPPPPPPPHAVPRRSSRLLFKLLQTLTALDRPKFSAWTPCPGMMIPKPSTNPMARLEIQLLAMVWWCRFDIFNDNPSQAQISWKYFVQNAKCKAKIAFRLSFLELGCSSNQMPVLNTWKYPSCTSLYGIVPCWVALYWEVSFSKNYCFFWFWTFVNVLKVGWSFWQPNLEETNKEEITWVAWIKDAGPLKLAMAIFCAFFSCLWQMSTRAEIDVACATKRDKTWMSSRLG